MRPDQVSRMRNRQADRPNAMNRTYDSNGPGVKLRGTARHVAEKYLQLARDAHTGADPVAAENYLQHAEHYIRLIAAAQAAPQAPGETPPDCMDNEDIHHGLPDRFALTPMRSPQAIRPTTEPNAAAIVYPIAAEKLERDVMAATTI